MQQESHKITWLQLIRSPGIGPIRFWQLLRRYQTVEKAINSLSNAYPYKRAEKEFALHLQNGYHLVAAFESTFPRALKRCVDCPPILSIYGNPGILNDPMLAIVGARNASLGGRQLSLRLAHQLGQAGWKIVSGLARGIDGQAHQGALPTGTIAVLAGGVDCLYPPEHQNLYHQIAEKGAVISEMPLGSTPAAGLFPRRNRLIAGLSQGVIVIEAAFRSGSLITAHYALEQGTEIFAVPGSPLDPRCSGSNNLIKQGACLVETSDDVLTVLGSPSSNLRSDPAPEPLPLSTKEEDIPCFPLEDRPAGDLKQQLLADLSLTALDIQSLLEHYDHYPPAIILGLLSELEIEGRVQRQPGNRISLMID